MIPFEIKNLQKIANSIYLLQNQLTMKKKKRKLRISKENQEKKGKTIKTGKTAKKNRNKKKQEDTAINGKNL